MAYAGALLVHAFVAAATVGLCLISFRPVQNNNAVALKLTHLRPCDVAGADPLAVTNSGMRPAALAAQGRFFKLRNTLEREAHTRAAYFGIELEELDTSQQVRNVKDKCLQTANMQTGPTCHLLLCAQAIQLHIKRL